MFTALFIAWKKRLNLLSTYLSSVVVNPINSSFIYFINYEVGSFIIGDSEQISLPITFSTLKGIVGQVYLDGLI